MIKALLLTLLAGSCFYSFAEDQSRAVFEAELDADIDSVWEAFTTNEGLSKWMAPIIDIDMKVGGKMRSNYNPNGKLGDPTTIENTILSFDTKRMLSLKATGYPEGFPFREAEKNTWSVFYFSKISSSRTKLTIVGLGYTDDEESQKMRSFFSVGNKQLIDKLNSVLQEKKAN